MRDGQSPSAKRQGLVLTPVVAKETRSRKKALSLKAPGAHAFDKRICFIHMHARIILVSHVHEQIERQDPAEELGPAMPTRAAASTVSQAIFKAL